MDSRRWQFSNFQEVPGGVVGPGGLRFPTVEHAYQASKSPRAEDWRTIQAQLTPGQAKRAGRAVRQMARWEQVKVSVMWGLLCQKFAEGGMWSRALAAFEGPIVEENTWHDTFWGQCVCSTHRGIGENTLGSLLSTIRAAQRGDRDAVDG